MNIYANVFMKITDFEHQNNSVENATYFFKKAIEFNTKNLELSQIEIDDLIGRFGNKSIEINKALLSANNELISEMPDKEALLFLTEKYFMMDGLAEILLKTIQPANRMAFS